MKRAASLFVERRQLMCDGMNLLEQYLGLCPKSFAFRKGSALPFRSLNQYFLSVDDV